MDRISAAPSVLTVTQLNARARQLLERQFSTVLVAGEVSNLTRHASGHCYFALKDQGGVINAVMFRREATSLRFALKDGIEVVATGRVTLYSPSGRYQLQVSRLEPRGAGALQAAFEQLKARLHEEGLFHPGRKRPLPRVPRRVAVISSPTGAVIRDIVHVSRRRFPNAQILLVPVRVQGAECAGEIAAAIQRVSAMAGPARLDALILARGGGSLEDLCGFNDEAVARSIVACGIPVVSAVGHETDFTIADFVADVRAPTPSAAAELVFPLKGDLIALLRRLVARSAQALRRDLLRQRQILRAVRAELGDGRAPLLLQTQRLATAHTRLEQRARQGLGLRQRRLAMAVARLNSLHPRVRLHGIALRLQAQQARLQQGLARHFAAQRQRLAYASGPRLEGPVLRQLAQRRHVLAALAGRLHALSPLGVLGRGYGIIFSEAGTALRRPDEVKSGQRLDIRLAHGKIWARVE